MSDFQRSILLVNTNAHRSFSQTSHLGLLYIASILKKNGYLPIYIDTGNKEFSIDSFIQKIDRYDPVFIGFTTDTDNYLSVFRLASCVKIHNSKIPVILGGPYASFDDMEIVKNSNVDVVVSGEGEYSCLEIADYYSCDKGSLSDISGITYKENNSPVRTKPRPPITALDDLPFPDYTLLPELKNVEQSIITGRGCPHHCAFCSEGRSGGFSYRFRKAQGIVDEVRAHLKVSPNRYLHFNDDTFTASPKRLLEICRLFRDNFDVGKELVWFCEGRADDISRHPEILDEMVSAGMVRLQIGIESGCQEILDIYKKGITLDQVRATIKACDEANVPSIYGGFIIGGAFETKDTVKQTVEFAEELIDIAPGRFECFSTYFAPYPGTAISNDPKKFGIKLLDREMVTTYSLTHCVNETESLTKDEIILQKNYFDAQVRLMMKKRISKVSNKTINKHCELYYEYGISTLWFEAVQSVPYSSWYFQTLSFKNFKSVADIDSKDVFSWCPTRVPVQVDMERGKILLKAAAKPIRFNRFGTMLYELSSGKLTLEEIINRIEQSCPDILPPKKVLKEQVLDFYHHLDREKVLLFKRF